MNEMTIAASTRHTFSEEVRPSCRVTNTIGINPNKMLRAVVSFVNRHDRPQRAHE